MSYDKTLGQLQCLLKQAGVEHFSAQELMTLGSSHYASRSAGYGLNKRPPMELLPNIIPAAVALDKAREKLGVAVGVNSTYRSPKYNKAIGGASKSFHKTFCAIDCHPFKPSKLKELYRLLKRSRDRGEWSGGLGRYHSFVHLDCGTTYNRDWGITY